MTKLSSKMPSAGKINPKLPKTPKNKSLPKTKMPRATSHIKKMYGSGK